MSPFKIQQGVSRIKKVKIQLPIEESIAADLELMSEWSNNDRNYVINELLRFAISKDSEFQKYKASRAAVNSHPSPMPSSKIPDEQS